jgi:diacylglycerol kinase family enzyme
MAIQLDGEIAGTLPAEIGVRPGALRIAGWPGQA